MKKLTLMSIVASGMFLLAGCGGGSSNSPMPGSAPPVTTAPVAPPVAQPPAEPDPGPMGKPDFTAYLSQVVVGPESDVPTATDDIEFAFADDEDDSVFAPLLDM